MQPVVRPSSIFILTHPSQQSTASGLAYELLPLTARPNSLPLAHPAPRRLDGVACIALPCAPTTYTRTMVPMAYVRPCPRMAPLTVAFKSHPDPGQPPSTQAASLPNLRGRFSPCITQLIHLVYQRNMTVTTSTTEVFSTPMQVLRAQSDL